MAMDAVYSRKPASLPVPTTQRNRVSHRISKLAIKTKTHKRFHNRSCVYKLQRKSLCKALHRRFRNLPYDFVPKNGRCKNDWFLRLPATFFGEYCAEEMTIHVMLERAPRSGPSAEDAPLCQLLLASLCCLKVQGLCFNQNMCQILMGATLQSMLRF